MVGKDPDKEWEKFGSKYPYYGVMTCDRYRKIGLNDQYYEEFFQTGRDHFNYVMDTIRASICPGFSPSTALDFGCGVGRIAIPMARVCQNVVGVDISVSMLEEAKINCTKQSLTNLEFHVSDDTLSSLSGKYDLIHSVFTLQHIPRNRGKRILKRLIELLSEEGIAVVDILIHRDVSSFFKTIGILRKQFNFINNIANILHGKSFLEPLMEKNIYDLNRIMKILYENGCGNLHIRTFRNGDHLDAILFFQKKRDIPVPHEMFFNEPHP